MFKEVIMPPAATPYRLMEQKAKNLFESMHRYFVIFDLCYRYFHYKTIGQNKEKYLLFFKKTYHNMPRYKGFRKIFEELLNKKSTDFTIIETGCSRKYGWGDGKSSFLFFEFISIFGGKLISIDIDEKNLRTCSRILRSIPKTGLAKFLPITGNSIDILSGMNEEVDLLYLDSMDLDETDPVPSMRHHLAELKNSHQILKKSNPMLVGIDDNFKESGIGKGKYILEWARKTDQEILSEDYQLIIRIRSCP